MIRRGLAWWQVVSFVAALAGTGVAAYLTRTHYNQGALICTVGDCATVQQSEYAELWGIPIALLGLGMYVALMVLGAVRWRRPEWFGAATLAAFALSLSGAVYAAYLTYLELFVIDAICQWCVASAILTVIVAVAEGLGVREWLEPVVAEDVPVEPESRANGGRRTATTSPARR